MNKIIEIEVDGVRARAILHEQAAPITCEAIWNLLPMDLSFRHTGFCGRQAWSPLEGSNFVKLERENAQLFIMPGDLIYAYEGPYETQGSGAGELSEIAFYYGRDARRWGNRGYGYVRDSYLGSTVWATVVEGLDDVGQCLEDCRTKGRKKVIIRRFTEG